MQAIKYIQNTLVYGSVMFLMIMPILMSYYPDALPNGYRNVMFSLSLAAVTWVMCIRPLADLLPRVKWVRPLVILRKGVGTFSASMIVAGIFSKMMLGGVLAYFATWFTAAYWSFDANAIYAHLGDVTALILLATSNLYSKRILGRWWKRVQRLAYVYFYAGALYELLAYDSKFAGYALILVTVLVLLAYAKNHLFAPARPRTVVSGTGAEDHHPSLSANTVRL